MEISSTKTQISKMKMLLRELPTNLERPALEVEGKGQKDSSTLQFQKGIPSKSGDPTQPSTWQATRGKPIQE